VRHEIAPGSVVLVVDDDPLIHQLLKVELEREGMQVVLAEDGVAALRLARDKAPAAIVLDMILPKLDGWTVLSELKSDPALARIPVIIVSVTEERARGFALGAVDYLVKPFEAQRLADIVSREIGAERGEILVVDDDAATCELVSRQLRAAGFTVSEARTGEEALLRVRVTRPALLVLDLCMPGMSGFEVLTQLRAEQIQVPVVVLTGKELTGAEEQALRQGMAGVVQKSGSSIDEIVVEAKRQLLRRQELRRLPRVLYVEDSAQNRDVVRRYLQGVFEVIEAEDGEHGLDRAQRDAPALILMDLSLPRLDGWEATRRLKAGPLRAIPVVALTAHASREDQQRARAAGCDGYLTKPVDREQLIETIQHHLQRKPAET
jgi:CheY-like chemotaxis protein